MSDPASVPYIESATPSDREGILALAASLGLFEAGDLTYLNDLFLKYCGSEQEQNCWIVDRDGSNVVGIAYFAPERMTSGTWNLYLIAVHPSQQGKGRGAALIRFVEDSLERRGQRMLLVETSGMQGFEQTRAFYRKCGYEEEARIRDFYEAGNDKIVFRKALSGHP